MFVWECLRSAIVCRAMCLNWILLNYYILPNLAVSEWVQGRPTNIDKESGNVILVEVFQVNCPGCFIRGMPQAIDMYKKYHDSGLRVLGLATAFEDFDKKTLENLKRKV